MVPSRMPFIQSLLSVDRPITVVPAPRPGRVVARYLGLVVPRLESTDGMGLQFLRADGTFPTTLRRGGSMTVDLQTRHDWWQRNLVDPICDPQ
jgi:hypothetical protein